MESKILLKKFCIYSSLGLFIFILLFLLLSLDAKALTQSFKDLSPYTDNTNTGQYGHSWHILGNSNYTLKNITFAAGTTSTYACIWIYSPWTLLDCQPIVDLIANFSYNVSPGYEYVTGAHKNGSVQSTKYNTTQGFPASPIESYNFIRWDNSLNLGTIFPIPAPSTNNTVWMGQIYLGFENNTPSTLLPKLNILGNFTNIYTNQENFTFKFNLSEENNGAWDGSNCSIFYDGIFNYSVFDPTTDTYPDTGDDILLNFSFPNTEKEFIFNMTCIGYSVANYTVANSTTANYHILVDNLPPRLSTNFVNNSDFYLLESITTNFNFSDFNISYYSVLFYNSLGVLTENYSVNNYYLQTGVNNTVRTAITLGYNFTIIVNITDMVNSSLSYKYFYNVLTSTSSVNVNLSKLENLTSENTLETKKLNEVLTMMGFIILFCAFLLLGVFVSGFFWQINTIMSLYFSIVTFANSSNYSSFNYFFATLMFWSGMAIFFFVGSFLLIMKQSEKEKKKNMYDDFYD